MEANSNNSLDTSLSSFKYDESKHSCFKETVNKLNTYNFNNIYVVNSLEEYILFINSLLLQKEEIKKEIVQIANTTWEVFKEDEYRKEFVFRGVSSIKEFKPTLFRDEDYSNYEFEFIKKFEENASLKLGQFNNPIDLAAAAQHFGIKTRLLDYSHSIIIATLFSLYKSDKDFYGVIIKDYDKNRIFKSLSYNKETTDSLTSKYGSMILNFKSNRECLNKFNSKFKEEFIKTSIFNYNDEENQKLLNEEEETFYKNILLPYVFDTATSTNVCVTKEGDSFNAICYELLKALFKTDSPIFLETNYSNERITAQRGLFEIYEDENHFISHKKDILLINKSARKEIIKYINRLGINYYLLMNDPASCSNEVNRDIIGELTYTSRIE